MTGEGDEEESESFTSSSKATDFARPFFSGLPSPSWNGFDGNLAGSDCRLLVALVGGAGAVSFGVVVFEGLLPVAEVLRARTGTGGGTFTGAVGSKGVADHVSSACGEYDPAYKGRRPVPDPLCSHLSYCGLWRLARDSAAERERKSVLHSSP